MKTNRSNVNLYLKIVFSTPPYQQDELIEKDT